MKVRQKRNVGLGQLKLKLGISLHNKRKKSIWQKLQSWQDVVGSIVPKEKERCRGMGAKRPGIRTSVEGSSRAFRSRRGGTSHGMVTVQEGKRFTFREPFQPGGWSSQERKEVSQGRKTKIPNPLSFHIPCFSRLSLLNSDLSSLLLFTTIVLIFNLSMSFLDLNHSPPFF